MVVVKYNNHVLKHIFQKLISNFIGLIMAKVVDLNELRESIAALIDLANEREIQLYEIQSVCKRSIRGFSARNYEGLKLKLNGEFDVEKLEGLRQKLNEFVADHIDFDDKLIQIFYGVKKIDKIKEQIDAYFVDKKNYGELSTNDYKAIKSTTVSEYQTIYQFGIIRETTVRKELSTSDLKESVMDEFQNVYGIKTVPLSCFDSLIIDLEGKIIITKVDLARVLGKNVLNVAQNNFYRHLRALIDDKSLSASFENPLDLFPKIQAFYEEPRDNKTNGVIEINFITPAGTAHYEKLRGNGLDLRTATYHEKGVEGVKNESENGVLLNNDITPYKIAKRYYRDEGNLEIALKSSYIAINKNNGSHLYEAYIYGTRTKSDLDFVLRKLIT